MVAGMSSRLRIAWIIALLNCAFACKAAEVKLAQANSVPAFVVPHTRVESLKSRVNGIDYRLYVGLPPTFDDDDGSHRPLLLLLDADYSFPIAQSVVTHLHERGDLPEIIVVGVAYGESAYRLNRTRDYTPTRVLSGGYGAEFQRHSGGAPAFATALEQEILPFLNARYRTRAKRVLVGHSYGGLLGTWLLLQRKPLFDGFILASPSLWYDDHLVLRLASEAGNAKRATRSSVYIGTGSLEINHEHNMPGDLRRLEKHLETLASQNPGAFSYRTEVLEDETHNSVFPRALSNGLRFHWPRER